MIIIIITEVGKEECKLDKNMTVKLGQTNDVNKSETEKFKNGSKYNEIRIKLKIEMKSTK